MLFNSFEFILLFAPVTLAVFFLIGKYISHMLAATWLVMASLFFYGWWNAEYLILIVASIVFNFLVGARLARHSSKPLLVFGIAANLGLLGYYKYFDFFIANVNLVAGTMFEAATIVLPLAISFFTFQQIAYLVDVHKGVVEEHNFVSYALFVTFFPQLIAGPIVHHKEILPQFSEASTYRFSHNNLALGISIFVVGLFKKVVIADNLSEYVSPIFLLADSGSAVSFAEAWQGSLGYTFQLYFDFSAYSDMAIGIARIFGVSLPINFNAPYRAVNIIEFWKRWHITLSRFLRDYLYIPLGGNRKGQTRRYANVLITMLLGGLWHGASWTFVAWGLLHGLYILTNHGWHRVRAMTGLTREFGAIGKVASVVLTFLSVVIAWVFFRAETFSGAVEILRGMVGLNGMILIPAVAEYFPDWIQFVGSASAAGELASRHAIPWLIMSAVIVWSSPSTQAFFRLVHGTEATGKGSFLTLAWKPTLAWGMGMAAMAAYVTMNLHRVSEFLYFNF